jgi:hypothetical protein
MTRMNRCMLLAALASGWTAAETSRAQRAPPPAPPPLVRETPVPAPDYRTLPPVPAAPSIPAAFGILSAVSEWRERAESLDHVASTPASPSYPMVQSDRTVEGDGAFHFANPGFVDHLLLLNPSFEIQPDTRLFFESRMGWAADAQIARVQISSDGGSSWTSLWSRAGDGASGQEFFELQDIPLGAHAGQTLRIRFGLFFDGGSAFTGTNSHIGWIVDDVQIGEAFVTRPYEGFGDPDAQEVLLVEFINRARASASNEAQRLRSTTDPDVLHAISGFGVDLDEMEAQFAALDETVQPLAVNARLTAAARLHAQDMFLNVFQGHVSSTNPPSPNQPGDTLSQRIGRQEYDYRTVGENVYAYAKSPWHGHAGFNLERAVARQRIVQLIHSHRFTEKPRRTLRVRLRFFSNR